MKQVMNFSEQELLRFMKELWLCSVKDNKTNLTTTKFLQLNSYVNNEDDNSSYHLHNNRVSQPNLITGSFSSHGYCYNITNVKKNENLVEEKRTNWSDINKIVCRRNKPLKRSLSATTRQKYQIRSAKNENQHYLSASSKFCDNNVASGLR